MRSQESSWPSSRPQDALHGAQVGPNKSSMAPSPAREVQHGPKSTPRYQAWHPSRPQEGRYGAQVGLKSPARLSGARFCIPFCVALQSLGSFFCSQVWHFSHMAFEFDPRNPTWRPSRHPGSGKRSSIAPSRAAEVQHGPRWHPSRLRNTYHGA